MDVSVEDISTVDDDSKSMNATATREWRPAARYIGSVPVIDPIGPRTPVGQRITAAVIGPYAETTRKGS